MSLAMNHHGWRSIRVSTIQITRRRTRRQVPVGELLDAYEHTGKWLRHYLFSLQFESENGLSEERVPFPETHFVSTLTPAARAAAKDDRASRAL
jgi:hypothetical protein